MAVQAVATWETELAFEVLRDQASIGTIAEADSDAWLTFWDDVRQFCKPVAMVE